MNTYQGGGTSQGKVIPIEHHFASLIFGIFATVVFHWKSVDLNSQWLSMVDQMLQNSTKQLYAFIKRAIFIQRIIDIFNEMIVLIQRWSNIAKFNKKIYAFNERTILIQRFIYIWTKKLFWFNALINIQRNN